MPSIKILPSELRNKIAAGEVVERPASVVKELIENSLDVRSIDISIDILQSGKRLIRVSDNGAGMDRDDALLAFERHATSKLSTVDDLFNIKTMGFRGEALPAIASVSKVLLITGTDSSLPGFSIGMHGGEIIAKKDAPPLTGTTVEVRDLFFNTPARRKFLKSDNTELNHIIDTVTKAAISHHKTGFRLSIDHDEAMNIPVASGIRERLMQLFGNEFLSGLIETSGSGLDIEMTAFVSGSRNFRNNKMNQYIFINHRPVKDQSISHAVYRGLEGILPPDKHPVFFVFLSLDPGTVDFNVHPAKREVRFQDKELIYRFVMRAVRDATRAERTEFAKPFSEQVPEPQHAPPSLNTPASYHADASSPVEAALSDLIDKHYRPEISYLYLGDTFIAVAGKGGLTVIDYHAAHERILFEKFLKGMNSFSHQLLFPKQVRLSAKEYKLLSQNTELVRSFGIEIDDFGGDTVIIRAIPNELEGSDMTGILSDIAAGLAEGNSLKRPIKEDVAARIACHSSVRGKTILNREEVTRLLEDLEKTEHPDQCPHGRPTRIFYTLNDLNKLFKRK